MNYVGKTSGQARAHTLLHVSLLYEITYSTELYMRQKEKNIVCTRRNH